MMPHARLGAVADTQAVKRSLATQAYTGARGFIRLMKRRRFKRSRDGDVFRDRLCRRLRPDLPEVRLKPTVSIRTM